MTTTVKENMQSSIQANLNKYKLGGNFRFEKTTVGSVVSISASEHRVFCKQSVITELLKEFCCYTSPPQQVCYWTVSWASWHRQNTFKINFNIILLSPYRSTKLSLYVKFTNKILFPPCILNVWLIWTLTKTNYKALCYAILSIALSLQFLVCPKIFQIS